MTLAKRGPNGLTRRRSLLNSLIELPDLGSAIQAPPAQTFAALVRKVGIEDAGELVAFATTPQLVQAFDEDLFVSDRASERESPDVDLALRRDSRRREDRPHVRPPHRPGPREA